MPVCRACEGDELAVLLDLGMMPLAGGFLEPSPEAIADEQSFPLVVHVCQSCGLVQIVDPVEPEILFHNYSFASSTIPVLVAHFEAYAQWLVDEYHPTTLVEFGCNDGILLGPLLRRGVVAAGVDLSDNIGEIARGRGYDVTTAAFDTNVAEELRSRLGPADIVTGSNAFAHNADPEAILRAADILLSKEGRLCLEVMYAGDLFEQLQWDTLYHEHLTFYGLSQLSVLLERNGFMVERAMRVPMHSGSLRVVAARSREARVSPSVGELGSFEASLGIDGSEAWQDYGRRCLRSIEVVSNVLGSLKGSHRIWAYGASGRATMWVNACELGFLEAVVDASPLRAGKLMPGTHTPIVFPEEMKRRQPGPTLVFVTAWNYLDAIRGKEGWYDGLWATPLPGLNVL